MRWFQARPRRRGQRAHEHEYQTQKLGAGLSRRICTACGVVSLAIVPMQCWATADSGARCRAFSLKSMAGPVCLAHARAAIDWRTAVLKIFEPQQLPSGAAVVITLESPRGWKERQRKPHLAVLGA